MPASSVEACGEFGEFGNIWRSAKSHHNGINVTFSVLHTDI